MPMSRGTPKIARLASLALIIAALVALPAFASAQLPPPPNLPGSGDQAPPDLNELLTCQEYPSGDRICSGTVPSFDGAPLDVDVTLPSGGGGEKRKLITLLHGFGADKHAWESNDDEGTTPTPTAGTTTSSPATATT
jgi:hypothetical protein